MNGNEIWIGLVLGLVPYHVERRRVAQGKCSLEVHALFWSLKVRIGPRGRRHWRLRVPLIERLRDAVWEAVMRLREDRPPQD